MAKEYLLVDGKLVKADTKLVQVPDTENLNDLADENGAYATQSEEVANEIEELIVNGVIDPRPSYTSTEANILSLTENKGIAVATDTGHWYYWNGANYVDSGMLYQSSEDIEKIKEDLVNLEQGYKTIDFEWEIGNISSGAEQETSNYYRSTFFNLDDIKESVLESSKSLDERVLIHCYDSNKIWKEQRSINVGDNFNVVSSLYSYVRFVSYKTDYTSISIKVHSQIKKENIILETKINNVENELDNASENYTTLDERIKSDIANVGNGLADIDFGWSVGGLSNGYDSDSSSQHRSEYIDFSRINESESVITGTPKDTILAWLYDGDKKYIGRRAVTNGTKFSTFPNNASYVRFSSYYDDYTMLRIIGKTQWYNDSMLEKRNSQYLCKAKLQDENSLLIEYQARHISNGYANTSGSVRFRFNGVLTVYSEKNGMEYNFTFDDFKTAFNSMVSYNGRIIEVPNGKRISFNSETNTIESHSSIEKIGNGEFVLIDTFSPYPISFNIAYNGIRGYLVDVYFKRMSAIYDIDNFNVRPELYLRDSIETKLRNIVANTNANSMLFTVTTDMHSDPFFKTYIGGNTSYSVVNYLHERLSPKFHIDLGDAIPERTSLLNKTNGLSNLIACASEFKKVKRLFRAIGNHDYNSNTVNPPSKNTHYFSGSDIFNAWGRHIDGAVWGSKEKFYYYTDFEEEKIRIVVLNTTENNVSFDENGNMTTPDPVNHSAMLQDQFEWLVNDALNFNDKGTDKTNWHTIVFTHIPASPMYKIYKESQGSHLDCVNLMLVHQILKAFKQGGTVNYSYTDTELDGMATVNLTHSFESQGSMNLIGCLSGHDHIQHSDWDYDGIAYKVLPCGFYSPSNHSGQIAYSENCYSASVISVNTSNRTMDCYFFGYGEDWSISY